MAENDVVGAILAHLKRQDGDWRFIRGRISLTSSQMVEKIHNDKKFRKTIVSMVNELSVDILLRHPK